MLFACLRAVDSQLGAEDYLRTSTEITAEKIKASSKPEQRAATGVHVCGQHHEATCLCCVPI